MHRDTDDASDTYREAARLAAQPPVFAERVRSTALSWGARSDWFDEVMHPPGPHSHPDATEIFVVLQGAFELEAGPERFTLIEGEMCLIPPDAVHDPLGSAETDLSVLSIVSPNRKGLRSAMSDVPASHFATLAERAVVHPGRLPSNHQLETEAYALQDGEELAWSGRAGVDRILVVLWGQLDVTVGRLHGRLTAGAMTFVPARADHAVVGRGPEPALLMATWASGSDTDPATSQKENA